MGSVLDATIVIFDPYSSDTISFLPELSSRIFLFARDLTQDKQAEVFTHRFLARLVLRDPLVSCALALIGETCVGHAIGEILVAEDTHEKTLYVLQCSVDPSAPAKTVDKLILAGDNWGRAMEVTKMRMETDRDPKAWVKHYGFRLVSHTLERDISYGFKKV